jgi:hypothetical protein
LSLLGCPALLRRRRLRRTALLTQGVEFGCPDFSNGLSRPGLIRCDWSYESYFRLPDSVASAQVSSDAGEKQTEELTICGASLVETIV